MSHLTLSLPDDLRKFADSQAVSRGYPNTEKYVEAVLWDERKRRAKEALESWLLDGINSGPATEWTQADVEELKRIIRARHGAASEA